MQAKGAVHWKEQRAGYQTMEEQAYMGHPPRIRGFRRFAAPQRPADQRAALQQLAAATQGRGTRPGCLDAADRMLSYAMSASSGS
jgi:hypothetical protein